VKASNFDWLDFQFQKNRKKASYEIKNVEFIRVKSLDFV